MSPGDYRRSSSVFEMHHNLKWTNLSTRRSVNRLTMIYKILNGHSAITSNNFFEFNKTQMRKKHNLTLRTYQPRGNIDKFAFVQRSIPEWNTLPNVVVQANTTEQFRVLLEKHLQQKPVAFIGILARHTHKFIFAIGSKALQMEDYKKKKSYNNCCSFGQY